MPVTRPAAISAVAGELTEPDGVFSHHTSTLATSANQNTAVKNSRLPVRYRPGPWRVAIRMTGIGTVAASGSARGQRSPPGRYATGSTTVVDALMRLIAMLPTRFAGTPLRRSRGLTRFYRPVSNGLALLSYSCPQWSTRGVPAAGCDRRTAPQLDNPLGQRDQLRLKLLDHLSPGDDQSDELPVRQSLQTRRRLQSSTSDSPRHARNAQPLRLVAGTD